jgi:ParB/RepB/Spo0J family partition protein
MTTARRKGQHRREPIGMPTEIEKAGAVATSKIEAATMLFESADAPVRMVRLDDIEVAPDRMRALRPEKVDEIAESIQARGRLLQPVVVRPRKGSGRYWLVSGWHRFEAVRKLGHDRMAAAILDGLDADAVLLAEIDENLIRADLTPAERAAHVGRRKELYEKLHPEAKHGAVGRGRKKSGQVGHSNERFTKDVAKKTGQSERKVRRDATRAKKVVVLPDIIGTSLDQGEELDALAKLSADEQRKLAEQAKGGENVSAKTRSEQVAVKPLSAPSARDDVGPDSASENARLRAELDQAGNENRRLNSENAGLRCEIEKFESADRMTRAAGTWPPPPPDEMLARVAALIAGGGDPIKRLLRRLLIAGAKTVPEDDADFEGVRKVLASFQ